MANFPENLSLSGQKKKKENRFDSKQKIDSTAMNRRSNLLWTYHGTHKIYFYLELYESQYVLLVCYVTLNYKLHVHVL